MRRTLCGVLLALSLPVACADRAQKEAGAHDASPSPSPAGAGAPAQPLRRRGNGTGASPQSGEDTATPAADASFEVPSLVD